MTAAEIEKIILKTTGDPSVGPIKDNAKAIAEAIAAALSGPKPADKRENRLMAKPEIPAAEQ